MTAPPEVPEVLLCGKVLVRKARGPGWVVGEPHGRTDGGQNMLRPGYYGTPDAALTSALYRAQRLCPSKGAQKLLAALLGGIPNATGTFPAWGLTDPGAWLRTMRREAGLTQQQLSQRSGVCKRQIGRIEQGKANPGGRTLARLAATFTVAE